MRTYIVKSCLVAVALCTVVLGCGGVASAHVLEQDNGIAAVLHIPPDDNPVANQSTSLRFAFETEQAGFSLDDCDCQVKVQSDDKTVQTVKLEHPVGGGKLDADAVVSFPTIGVYDVIVTGSSKTGEFRSFSLDYIERVATANSSAAKPQSNRSQGILLISVAALLVVALAAYVAISYGGRYKTVRTGKDTITRKSDDKTNDRRP